MGIETFFNLPGKKRDRIIDVSIEEFASRGYKGASVNSIVKKLNIAKGSIFNYFGDKEGLFIHIFNYSVEKVKDYLRNVRDETTNRDIFSRLKSILSAGVEFTEKYPYIYRVYIRMILNSDIPLREDLQKAIRENAHEFLVELLEDARNNNEINPELNLNLAAFTIEAVMDRFLQTRILPFLDSGTGIFSAEKDKIEEFIDEIILILKSGLSK